MSKEQFEPHHTCKSPIFCKNEEVCQRALTIEQEMAYSPKEGRLKHLIETEGCEHPQAIESIKKAKEHLNQVKKSK